MPVIPGFDAWAVNGFIERSENPDNPASKPMPISPGALEQLTGGFTISASDMVFVGYADLGGVISTFREKSMGMDIRPLDRGGFFVSCVPTADFWTRILAVIEPDGPVDVESTVSDSK